MKKKLQLFIAFLTLILPSILISQVTVTNSIFPTSGDTLRIISGLDAGGFDPEIVGEDIEWDLTGITAGPLSLTIFSDPTEGDASDMFPNADFLDKSTNQEIYYQSFNNKIIEIGRSGLDPVLNAINLSFQNDGESVFRRAPMSFGDIYNDDYSFSVAASSALIPDTLLPNPEILATIDSLRLTVETHNDDVVDAWGTLKLQDGDYDVVRIKRKINTNAILEIKVAFLGWSVLDDENPLTDLLGPLADLLGETETTSYQFYANDNKEVMADLTYDEEGILLSSLYKGDISTSIGELDLKSVGVNTYPNPTYGNVTFELSNLPKGEYSVNIYNIIGKELWSSKIDYLSGRLNADLTHLRKGTYLYSIIDKSGRKITTKRLMIITP